MGTNLGPRYAPYDPTLPEPWKGFIDGSTGSLYYWNPATNVTQYEKPTSHMMPTQSSQHPVPLRQHGSMQKFPIRQQMQPMPHVQQGQTYPGAQMGPQHGFQFPQYMVHQQNMPPQGPQSSSQQFPINRNQREIRIGDFPSQNPLPSLPGRLNGPGGSALPVVCGNSSGASSYPSNAFVRPPLTMMGPSDPMHGATATGENVPAPFMTFESTGFPPEMLHESQLQQGQPSYHQQTQVAQQASQPHTVPLVQNQQNPMPSLPGRLNSPGGSALPVVYGNSSGASSYPNDAFVRPNLQNSTRIWSRETECLYRDLCRRGDAFTDQSHPFFWGTERVLDFFVGASELMKTNWNLMTEFKRMHFEQVFRLSTNWLVFLEGYDLIKEAFQSSTVDLDEVDLEEPYGLLKTDKMRRRVFDVGYLVRAISNLIIHIDSYVHLFPNREAFRQFVSHRIPTILSYTYNFFEGRGELQNVWECVTGLATTKADSGGAVES